MPIRAADPGTTEAKRRRRRSAKGIIVVGAIVLAVFNEALGYQVVVVVEDGRSKLSCKRMEVEDILPEAR